MHGQYPERVGKPDINQESTHQWLKNSGLKAETVQRFHHSGTRSKLTNNVVPAQDYKKMAQIQNAKCVTTVMKV